MEVLKDVSGLHKREKMDTLGPCLCVSQRSCACP